jgi:hypothetical protein
MMVGESKKLSERSSQEKKIPAITINSTLLVQPTVGHAIQSQY